MRVVKRAVVGIAIVGAMVLSLYFAYVGTSVKSTRMTPVTVVSEVLE